MSEDKTITMEMITFVKYKDECYEIGEVIKRLLNKLDEKNDEIERLNNIINELYTKANDTNITSLDLREYILNNLGDDKE